MPPTPWEHTSGLTDLAVVVVADAPRPGRVKTGLEPLLGADGCARLQAALVARTARWALEHAAPGAAYVAFAPADARDAVAALVPDGVELFAQADGPAGARLEAAFAEAAGRSGRPVVLVGADLPVLRGHHAWAVTDDFGDGVDVVLGPATNGGYYLLAAREPSPALFGIDSEAWGGERVLSLTLESVVGAGLSMGWLRSERALDTPADAAALMADPCAPGDVVAALRG
jgi:glycosyltransferase A (GT-A) superfamily protein (DUF2064 family)